MQDTQTPWVGGEGEPVGRADLPTLSGALSSWWPTEKLMLFRATQQVQFVMEGNELRASFSGRLVDADDHSVGELTETFLPGHIQNGVFTSGPLDLRQILEPPPRVVGTAGSPTEIPESPLLGRLDTKLVFDAGLEVDFAAGMSVRAEPLDDGGHLVFFCASGFLRDAVRTEAGVRGVGSVVGSGALPANTPIEPGIVFQTEAIFTLRVTTSASRALLPEETSLAADHWAQQHTTVPNQIFEVPTVIATESILTGFGAEISEVHADAHGLYLIAEGQMFDYAKKPVGNYRGIMPMPDSARDSATPPEPPITGHPSLVPSTPFEATFDFEDRGSITLVGNSTLEKISILEGGAQLLMVSGTGLITGGTGAFEHVSGVGGFTSSTLSPQEVPTTPGDRMPFKTTYQLQVLQPATIRPVRPQGSPRTAFPTPEPSTPEPPTPEPPLPSIRALEERTARRLIPDLPTGVDPRTYHLETVDRLFAKVASFLLLSPGTSEGVEPIVHDGQWIGFHFHFPLFPLSIENSTFVPGGFQTLNRTSASAVAGACLTVRFAPDDFEAHPGREPDPTPFDLGQGQSFVVIDAVIQLHDDEKSRVRLFGTGQTFPGLSGVRDRLSMGMVLAITESTGQLRGLPGMVSANILLGVPGPSSFAFLLRVADPEGSLLAPRAPELPSVAAGPDLDSTFFSLLGQNNTKDSTRLTFGSDGKVDGAALRQQQSFVQTTFSGTEGGPIHTASEVGPIVSYLFADLAFDLTGPPPISFTTKNAEFQLRDSSGSYVGSLLANIVEGRGFLTSLPGAPMPILRGAALAPIRGGSGAFAEARGLVTVVNWISIFPRQVSGYFLVRLDDPTGRYREALQQASCATCTDFRLSPPWSSERS